MKENNEKINVCISDPDVNVNNEDNSDNNDAYNDKNRGNVVHGRQITRGAES